MRNPVGEGSGVLWPMLIRVHWEPQKSGVEENTHTATIHLHTLWTELDVPATNLFKKNSEEPAKEELKLTGRRRAETSKLSRVEVPRDETEDRSRQVLSYHKS